MFGLSQDRESRAPSHPPALVGRTDFVDWDSEISGSLLFQPSDSALMFKYMCITVCYCVLLKIQGRERRPQSLTTSSAEWPGWQAGK